MIFRRSRWLWVKDGYWRMFVRWLYEKTLDELYIPIGTRVLRKRGDELHGTRGVITGGRVCSKGKGLQEWWFDFSNE